MSINHIFTAPQAIQLQRVLDHLTERKAKFSLAIIDACRDNPFKTAGRDLGGDVGCLPPQQPQDKW